MFLMCLMPTNSYWPKFKNVNSTDTHYDGHHHTVRYTDNRPADAILYNASVFAHLLFTAMALININIYKN